jgi:ribosomal protein S12 methylthiotransferase accessory factor
MSKKSATKTGVSAVLGSAEEIGGDRMNASVDASDVLAQAWTAARACGVTRLADLTRLDRLGVPVFHAVRPLSRALAVSQGKGFTPAAAQIGALMESVESAYAEAFARQDHVGPLTSLPPDARPPAMADFAVERHTAPEPHETLAWVRAERLTGEGSLYVPFDCVSLDCSVAWDPRLERSSNGLAARFDWDGAVLKGLLELIERDALAEWRAGPLVQRATDAISVRSVPYPWFQEVAGRAAGAGIRLVLYAVTSVVGLPVIAVELHARAGEPMLSACRGGWACAANAEAALQAALLEAAQCRLTAISGARDDIFHPVEGAIWRGDGVPLPPALDPLDWRDVEARTSVPWSVTPASVADQLAAAGFPDVAVVRVSAAEDPVKVAKVFAPGLAAFRRARRPRPKGGV